MNKFATLTRHQIRYFSVMQDAVSFPKQSKY
jgi:hypothetical protein